MSLRGTLMILACVGVGAGSAFPPRTASQPASPKVRVELLSEVRAIAPGESFWVALHQRVTPGWHTYWMNPGDSGEPVRVEWTLPSGFMAGDIACPFRNGSPSGLR